MINLFPTWHTTNTAKLLHVLVNEPALNSQSVLFFLKVGAFFWLFWLGVSLEHRGRSLRA